VHTALAGVALRAVRGDGLVDDTLLHDGAVYGEAVGGGLVGLGGCGGGDEGLEDGVLEWGVWLVRRSVRTGLERPVCRSGGGAYDDL
jgi:hypothetical protein